MLLFLGCASAPVVNPVPEPEIVDPAPGLSEHFYLAMVDRFHDGKANAQSIDPEDAQGWHGGDVDGVVKELDRLQSLGVSTIWLTPLTQSRQIKFHEWGAYHGYWPVHLDAIEPRFGSWSDVTALRNALDERGMHLMLDMVYNHVGFDSPLRETHPDWFHEAETISDWSDPEQVLTGQVHGLPDLAQEKEEVAQYLIDATLLWLEKTGARFIRVDAVRHIAPDFIQKLKNAIHTIHGDDVSLVGEIFEGDAMRLWDTWKDSSVDLAFDFPLHYALLDSVCGTDDMGRLASALSLDRIYANPNRLITFLDNHDLPRFASRCDRTQAESALRLMVGLRGQPSITWGSEVLEDGAEEPENRHSFSGDTEHPANAWITALLQLRKESPALQYGQTRILHLDTQSMVFLRIHGKHAALVGLSTQNEFHYALPEWLHKEKIATLVGNPKASENNLVFPVGTSIVLFAPSARIGTQSERLKTTLDVPPMREVLVRSPSNDYLTGAGPELGHWDPQTAHPFQEGMARFQFPIHQVLSFKRIQKGDSTVWEGGPNHTFLIPPGDAPFEIDLTEFQP